VEFAPNFDDTLSEPTVLPASIPNLLVNGATGIAVGMSTSVPPHNLSEVIDALVFMLNRWEKLDDINVDDLMQFIKGPDFPTGGIIISSADGDSLKTAYGSGRGRITLQARAHLEEMSRGRTRIIVTELPYMTNKSSLIERIASLTRDGKLDGIADLRDESDREGMRIVIELFKGVDPNELLGNLYQRTPMKNTFSIINLALVEGEPRLLSLKQALRVYLEHRDTVLRRRSKFELEKARHRAHILEGLRVALKNLDEVIDLIRRSRSVDTARSNLKKRFKLSDDQAQAILNMPLRRLAALERKKIEEEYKELLKQIRYLEGLLRSPKKIRQVISSELEAIKEAYGDRRRTQIVQLDAEKPKTAVLTARDLAPDKQVWVTVTPEGLISRTSQAKTPRLSGRKAPAWLSKVNTQDTLYLVAENGKAAAIGVHILPETNNPMEGTEFRRLSPFSGRDELAAVFNLPPKDVREENYHLVTITRGGMVKKSAISEIPGPTAQTFTLVRVNEGDRLGWIHLSNGEEEILMATSKGMAIRFSEEEVRPMGLVAAGVMGIKLKVGDEVIGADLVPKRGEIFLLRSDGQAKRVKIDQFPSQGRYGQGIIAWKLPKGARLVGLATGKPNFRVITHLFKLAPKSLRLDSAPVRTRQSHGHSVVDIRAGDRIVRLTIPQDLPRPIKKEPSKRKRKTSRRTTKKQS
jgi:DNA gyrase subunit A